MISAGPKPVAVRLCFGLVNPGPMGPWSSDSGALVEGLRSRGERVSTAEAIVQAVSTGETKKRKKQQKKDGAVKGKEREGKERKTAEGNTGRENVV